MATVSIDIPVVCATCGDDLDATIDRRGIARVDPCKACCDEAREKGHDEGVKDADEAAER
jgi:hypothetical protein